MNPKYFLPPVQLHIDKLPLNFKAQTMSLRQLFIIYVVAVSAGRTDPRFALRVQTLQKPTNKKKKIVFRTYRETNALQMTSHPAGRSVSVRLRRGYGLFMVTTLWLYCCCARLRPGRNYTRAIRALHANAKTIFENFENSRPAHVVHNVYYSTRWTRGRCARITTGYTEPNESYAGPKRLHKYCTQAQTVLRTRNFHLCADGVNYKDEGTKKKKKKTPCQ